MAKPPDKKETLLAFLERGVAMLHIDARRPGVVVPPQHATDAHLLLNFSYRYAIPDLTIDGRGVRATLSFRSQPYACTLPWSAVFGMTSQPSGAGQAWPEDIPAEVTDQFQASQGGGATPKAAPKAAPRSARKPRPASARPVLRGLEETPEKPAQARPAALKAEATREVESELTPAVGSAKADGAPRPAVRGHLRLVK